MNYDSIWQNIRYFLIAAAAAAVTVGVVKSEHQSFLTALISQLDTVGPGLIGLGVWFWGNYVKWGTTPVQDAVIERRSIPVVSSATGVTTETKK